MPDLSMTAGNDLRVDYEAENFGDLTYDPSGDTDIRLVQSSTTEDSDPATVNPDAVVDGSLFWTGVPSGTHTVIVETDDGTDSIEVEATSAIPTTGDTQYYIDAGSGTTLTDELGTVDASINGASWVDDTDAVGGEKLSFDGTDDYWKSDSDKDMSQFTACAWVQPNDYSGFSNQMLGAGDSVNSTKTPGFYVDTESTSGEILTAYADSTTGGSTANRNVDFVSTGNWGFFAATYDGTDSRLITFDTSKQLADDTVSNNLSPTGTVPWYGGGNPGDGDHFDGDQDFVVLKFGGTLTKTEIKDLWSATNNR